MELARSDVSQESVLFQLGKAFTNFRNTESSGKLTYPLPLRRRAVALVSQGLSFAVVARECGISPISLRTWERSLPPEPRRLAVVEPEPEVEALEMQEGEKKGSELMEEKGHTPVFRFGLPCGVTCEAKGSDALWLIRALGREP